MVRTSVCTSSMSGRQQTVIHGHIHNDGSELWQARRYRHAYQVPHRVKAGQRCLIQQQPEGDLHLALGSAGRQVQNPYVIAIGPLRLAVA